jgi:hypothetical protein
MTDLSFFAPWMLWPSLGVMAVVIGHKRYFFEPNQKSSPLGRFMLVFLLYFLPCLVALFFAVLSATNLALRAGYGVPPLLRQLVFFGGCLGLVVLVIRRETLAVAAGGDS